MIIQVIGLPGTGKTTYIKKYLKNNETISYLDIANYSSNARKKKLYNDINKIRKQNTSAIIESACGLSIKNSKIIKLNKNYREVYMNFKNREQYLDEDYLSLLDTYSINPDFTVSNKKTLFHLLDKLFFKYEK